MGRPQFPKRVTIVVNPTFGIEGGSRPGFAVTSSGIIVPLCRCNQPFPVSPKALGAKTAVHRYPCLIGAN